MTGTRPLSDAERLDWLRLIRSERVGPVTFHQLLRRYGDVASVLERLPMLAQRGGRKDYRVCPAGVAAAELERTRAAGVRLLAWGEPGYPSALMAVEDAPPLLSLLGHGHLLDRAAVAMVGSRNATINGSRFAQRLAADLGKAGWPVVSGLARGIDAAAHQGALDSGTVAVLGGGVDVIYPKENTDLYRRIVAEGVVVSEMPVGTVPQARHFPRRNRIISGLSLGVVVVEATLRSGSLITARIAGEQGREVGAVPGGPTDPRAAGCNRLIRDGAALIRSAEDVAEMLRGTSLSRLREPNKAGLTAPPLADPSEKELDKARRTILKSLDSSPVGVDEIVRQCQLSPATVQTVLLELELAGRIERHPGHAISLII